MDWWNFGKKAFIKIFGKGRIYNYVHRVRHRIRYVNDGDFIIVKQRGQPDILRPKNDYSIKLPLNFDLKVKTVRVAAVAHIFYIELAEKMKNLMYNIPLPFDIYISTTDENKKIALEKIFADFKFGKVTVKVFENRGRDIAPAFVGFKDIYKDYDLCVHIHSKKSPHDSTLAGWGEYLYQCLLGSREIVSGILHIMENENIGVVFPQYFKFLVIGVNFGKNYTLAQEFLSRLKLKLETKNFWNFQWVQCFGLNRLHFCQFLKAG